VVGEVHGAIVELGDVVVGPDRRWELTDDGTERTPESADDGEAHGGSGRRRLRRRGSSQRVALEAMIHMGCRRRSLMAIATALSTGGPINALARKKI
jgi:hypothetical protein